MSDDRLDQLDYYDLLQVEESANADDVRRAFHAFAAKFHPDRFSGAPEKQERAGAIYRRGAEAYRVLCDREQRRVYDEQRARGKLRFDPEERPSERPGGPSVLPPSGAIQVRSPKARPFAQKALDAYKKSDWSTAKLNLKLAIQHEPGNALLEARLADVEQKLRAK
ncbi:MAG: DnaJ domain-containing protein [Myxococcota bacterium]|nr:DnaJ domain-containing protein [Myxococcota bacterium]